MNILNHKSQLKMQCNCDESIFDLDKGPFSLDTCFFQVNYL